MAYLISAEGLTNEASWQGLHRKNWAGGGGGVEVTMRWGSTVLCLLHAHICGEIRGVRACDCRTTMSMEREVHVRDVIRVRAMSSSVNELYWLHCVRGRTVQEHIRSYVEEHGRFSA